MATSHFSSRKASDLMNINSGLEALPDQDVISLVVVFRIWAVPCPFAGWFVRSKGFVSTKFLKLANSLGLDLSHLTLHCSRDYKHLPCLPEHVSQLKLSNPVSDISGLTRLVLML